MTAPRNTPSAGIDPEYAWAVGDHWLTAQHLLFTLASGAFLVIVVLVVSSFSRRALTLANRRKELERLKSQEADSKNDDLKRGL